MISIQDLSKKEILTILNVAEEFKKKTPLNLLRGKILASCFYEPSTRTRLSFETAMLRLGGAVIGFSDAETTSTNKGESLYDTMKIMGGYADVIVLRHPMEGAARLASEATKTPVINAGDGANQHPTQTLIDLFTMRKLKGLHIAFVGDLKYGRTVHSLVQACSLFDMRFYFISPEQLTLPDQICQHLRRSSAKFSFHRTLEEVMHKLDILYMTRIQKERLEDGEFAKKNYILKEEMLKDAKKTLKILHPLPRLDEIERDVDKSSHAYYFEQAQNGLYVREAILAKIIR